MSSVSDRREGFMGLGKADGYRSGDEVYGQDWEMSVCEQRI